MVWLLGNEQPSVMLLLSSERRSCKTLAVIFEWLFHHLAGGSCSEVVFEGTCPLAECSRLCFRAKILRFGIISQRIFFFLFVPLRDFAVCCKMLTQLHFCTGSPDAFFCLGIAPERALFSCFRTVQLNPFSQAKALTE